MRDTLAMMRSFFSDLWRDRAAFREQDRWIRKYAESHGYSVNSRWMIYTNLKLWLVDSQRMFGRRVCPCFEPSGEAELDRKLLCPCAFVAQEIEERGTCHCTLFGRSDLTKDDYKQAQVRLMGEYRGEPLRVVDGTLDTRGMPLDPLRGLSIPDALHQVKRALGHPGPPLTVLVATRTEADHLGLLADAKGLASHVEELPDHVSVRIGRRSAVGGPA